MKEHLNILILEDNPADVEFIRRELRLAGIDFTVLVADEKEEFVRGIKEFRPDVILSDHSLPQFNSLEALSLAREFSPASSFLLVTGAVSEEFAVQIMNEGADDYILKDRLTRLPTAIRNAMLKKESEKERIKMVEQLLEVNSELNTFLYKATHDLRGPLTSIMGLTNLAMDEKNEKRAHEYIRMIADCTSKLDSILLSLVKTMTIKNVSLSMNEVNIGQLIASILQQLEFIPGFSRLKVAPTIRTTRKFVTDENILSSILLNLIENAVKYQDVSKALSFVTIDVSDSKKGVKIEIEDNGIGIPSGSIAHVFEMFYRGNESSKGSGLGLYIVKHGLQRLGGKVDMTSQPGRGTKFTLRIPSLG